MYIFFNKRGVISLRIGVVGLGYVGLTLSIAAADCDLDVYGIEVNPHIKKCLNNNCAHFLSLGWMNY